MKKDDRGLGWRRIAGLAALATTVVLVPSAGCGGEDGDAKDPGTTPPVVERSVPRDKVEPAEAVVPSHCPSGTAGCRTTEGRITFEERVDPDGDGDVHFVVVDPQSITLPGLTAIDVSRDLRPRPLPEVGELISAAGPVQTGSYGQSQIHALELHVAGR